MLVALVNHPRETQTLNHLSSNTLLISEEAFRSFQTPAMDSPSLSSLLTHGTLWNRNIVGQKQTIPLRRCGRVQAEMLDCLVES